MQKEEKWVMLCPLKGCSKSQPEMAAGVQTPRLASALPGTRQRRACFLHFCALGQDPRPTAAGWCSARPDIPVGIPGSALSAAGCPDTPRHSCESCWPVQRLWEKQNPWGLLTWLAAGWSWGYGHVHSFLSPPFLSPYTISWYLLAHQWFI